MAAHEHDLNKNIEKAESSNASSNAQKKPGRYHPLFPTYEEVEKDENIAHSDHLPVLFRVPTGKNTTVNILSYNVLGIQGSSGIHRKRVVETEEQAQNRYNRIAEFLVNADNNHELDSIILQEASGPELEKALKEHLGDNWVIMPCKEQGLISCYKKSSLTLIKGSTIENTDKKIHSNTYKCNKSGKIIEIHNVWSDYSPFPNNHEAEYEELLRRKKGDKNVIRFLGGDTNSRGAPISDEKTVLNTTLIPHLYVRRDYNLDNDHNRQAEDWPDCGFYSDENDIITQLKNFILDPLTGEIYNPDYDPESQEINYDKNYRMVLCLDGTYKIKEISKGATLFEMEDYLREILNDNSILVRMSVNGINEKAIGLRFSNKSQFANLLFDQLKHLPGCVGKIIDGSRENETVPYPCLFVPMEHLEKLENAIFKLTSERDSKYAFIADLKDEQERLSSKIESIFKKSPAHKRKVLDNLEEKIKTQHPYSTSLQLSKVRYEWLQEERRVRHQGKEKMMTNEELLNTRRGLLGSSKPDEAKPTSTLENVKRLGR